MSSNHVAVLHGVGRGEQVLGKVLRATFLCRGICAGGPCGGLIHGGGLSGQKGTGGGGCHSRWGSQDPRQLAPSLAHSAWRKRQEGSPGVGAAVCAATTLDCGPEPVTF